MKETSPAEDDQATAGEDVGIRDILRILQTMSADMLSLVMVEARLFGHTALAMIGLALVIALLLVSSWLFIGAALVIALTSLQAFSLTTALLTVALAHLLLATFAFWRLRYSMRDLRFHQSRASAQSVLAHARSVLEASEQRPKRQ
ncbi:MAG: hypothetical protein HQL47_08040 [Gammaproteobacteria bacterium]|nr:hypothetical protein [Gammaproteobacteria bacterium]